MATSGDGVREGSKSVLLAYLLWAIGGWFGLHHIYLERDEQALLWSTSFCAFGAGWFRDFFRIPDYVAQANLPRAYRRLLAVRAKNKDGKATAPEWYISRYLCMIYLCDWYGNWTSR